MGGTRNQNNDMTPQQTLMNLGATDALYDREIKAIGGHTAAITPADIQSFSVAEKKIIQLMADGSWYSDFQIIEAAQQREALRRLRSLRRRGFTVEKRRCSINQLFRCFIYRLSKQGGCVS